MSPRALLRCGFVRGLCSVLKWVALSLPLSFEHAILYRLDLAWIFYLLVTPWLSTVLARRLLGWLNEPSSG